MIERNDIIQNICDAVSAECTGIFDDRLLALILTGSAAREETTIVRRESGWKILGDAEFLVVVQKNAKGDEVFAGMIERESVKKLRSLGIDVEIGLAVVNEAYLKELPPYIFSYELRARGKVISGDAAVLELIPQYSAKDISREDAWRLLCNRMIEQLGLVDEFANLTETLSPRLNYATVKLFLDMATSYLIFTGSYAPTYSERSAVLQELAQQSSSAAPFPLKKFAERVAECTSWKLSGDDADSDRRVEFWHDAISYMRRLWRWEMIQLTNGQGELTISALSKRFAAQQNFAQRMRGWVSLAKRSGWLKSIVEWPRWLRLSFSSTPRYLVYQAASEVAFRLPCLMKHDGQPPRLDVNWRKLRSLLPEHAPRTNSPQKAAWREIVDDVLWNYSQYLQNTRA